MSSYARSKISAGRVIFTLHGNNQPRLYDTTTVVLHDPYPPLGNIRGNIIWNSSVFRNRTTVVGARGDPMLGTFNLDLRDAVLVGRS